MPARHRAERPRGSGASPRSSNIQGIADIRFFFGNPSDVPLAGDFDGDGCDTLSIYRPSEQRFYVFNQLGENDCCWSDRNRRYSIREGSLSPKPGRPETPQWAHRE